MANYDTDTHSNEYGTLALCAAGLNTKIETIGWIDQLKKVR